MNDRTLFNGLDIEYLALEKATTNLSGGEIVFEGTPDDISNCAKSKTGMYLKRK